MRPSTQLLAAMAAPAKPTEEQVQLLLIRGHVAGLTEAHQQQVQACAAQLRETIAAADKVEEGIGHIAMALVGAELAAAS